jgi:ADP-heptose:LPS heptosyltransferase
MRYEPIADVRRIAVLRANAIGDFLFALPALESLRAAYPSAEVVLLGRAWHADFLAGRPGPVDRVVVVPPCQGINETPDRPEDPEEVQSFFARMRAERFDLALQLHGGGRYSNPFVRRLGARLSAGLKTPDAEPLDRWAPYVYFQPEILRYLEAVSLVGAAPVTLEPRLAVTPRDMAEANRVLPDSPRPLAVLHSGASDPQRRWPAEKFALVGDALVRAGARVVVTGTGEERAVVRAVCSAMRTKGEDLSGRVSLGGLAGLLTRCVVMVANDTGPLHLAAAVGAATVGVYWCFNLANSCELTRARHRPFAAWRLVCPECGRNCLGGNCGHPVSFVADVPAEEVTAAALELLSLEG